MAKYKVCFEVESEEELKKLLGAIVGGKKPEELDIVRMSFEAYLTGVEMGLKTAKKASAGETKAVRVKDWKTGQEIEVQ